jgi:hypothetical protein
MRGRCLANAAGVASRLLGPLAREADLNTDPASAGAHIRASIS